MFPDAVNGANGSLADSNTIMNAHARAINFFCNAASATRNTINDANIGANEASSGALDGDTYYNVDTIKTGCN